MVSTIRESLFAALVVMEMVVVAVDSFSFGGGGLFLHATEQTETDRQTDQRKKTEKQPKTKEKTEKTEKAGKTEKTEKSEKSQTGYFGQTDNPL